MSEDSGGLSNNNEDEPPDEIGENLPASIYGDDEELQEVTCDNLPSSINGDDEEQHLVRGKEQQGQCFTIILLVFLARLFCCFVVILVIAFSDMENWTFSENYCRELGAQLARFDNQEELVFLNRKKGLSTAWIGLHRESSEHPWMWTDNTKYNNVTLIRGDANHAYLSDRGISSSRDYIPRSWICSKPNSYTLVDSQLV